MVSDLGVDAVCEVDYRSALRKIEHIALRREDEDFFRKQVILDGREEFLRILEILLPFDKPPEPREAFGLAQVAGARPALLVAPVGGDSFLGHAMHLGG